MTAFSDGTRRAMLAAIKGKLGSSCACEALGVATPSLSRYLGRERRVPDDVVRRTLAHLPREEFERPAGGVVGEDGSVDYGLFSVILLLAAEDEYLRGLVLQFAIREFRRGPEEDARHEPLGRHAEVGPMTSRGPPWRPSSTRRSRASSTPLGQASGLETETF